MRAYRDDEIETYVSTGDPLISRCVRHQNAGFHPVEAMQAVMPA